MQSFAFLSNLGGTEIVVIAVIALLLFGKRLPEVARNFGKGMAEFKRGMNEATSEVKREMDQAADAAEAAKREVEADVQKMDAEAAKPDSGTPKAVVSPEPVPPEKAPIHEVDPA
ncbi:MAG: hypothetical protein AMXMBFR7_43840 [Planctomycetota bacterium]